MGLVETSLRVDAADGVTSTPSRIRTARLETAEGILRIAYRLRDELMASRRRGLVFAAEVSYAKDQFPNAPDTSTALWEVRYRDIQALMPDLNRAIVDAEVFWDNSAREPLRQLKGLINRFFIDVSYWLSMNKSTLADDQFTRRLRNDLFGPADNETDDLGERLMTIVSTIEVHFKPIVTGEVSA